LDEHIISKYRHTVTYLQLAWAPFCLSNVHSNGLVELPWLRGKNTWRQLCNIDEEIPHREPRSFGLLHSG